MNFKLTEEQRAFRDAVRAFAEKHLREGALARAHDPGYPWDVAQADGRAGAARHHHPRGATAARAAR